jgi:putative protease
VIGFVIATAARQRFKLQHRRFNIHSGPPIPRNTAFERLLKKKSAVRTVAVEMVFVQDAEGIRVSVEDEDGNRVERSADMPFEPARDPSAARKQIEKHLGRTGNTPYRVIRLNLPSAPQGFVPPSRLNGLRREVLDALTLLRMESRVREEMPFAPNDAAYPEKHLDYRANVLNKRARQFYERHGVETIEPAFETFSEPFEKQVMATRYCIRHQLGLCMKHQQVKQPPKEPLKISDGRHVYRLAFDCRRCRMTVFLEGKGGKKTNVQF